MGLIVDNFAGGGGASTGIEQAIGRKIDIAINHDPAAILMHKTNHPNTIHYTESVWDVDIRKITQGKEVRCSSLREPIATIPTQNRFGLVEIKFQDINLPIKDGVAAFLTKYYGCDTGQSINGPIHTITTKDRFGLVTIRSKDYKIADIGLRMLSAKELFAGQGFPKDYIIERDYTGKKYPTTQQKARCGNAVVPALAKALVQANVYELFEREIAS